MAKLPNRLVIEIAKMDKVDELGNPVIGYESKDYAECVIEELENILVELDKCSNIILLHGNSHSFLTGVAISKDIVKKHIYELKGENK